MIIQVIMNNSTCYNREVAQVMKNKKAVRKSEKQQVYQLESYTLTDLEQIRILADPLRIRDSGVLLPAGAHYQTGSRFAGRKADQSCTTTWMLCNGSA